MARLADRTSFSEGEMRTEGPVVYWSVLAHRFEENQALARAIELANENGRKLQVVATILAHGSAITKRQLKFAIEGLRAMKDACEAHDIPFVLVADCSDGLPKKVLDGAAAIVTDFGYLKPYRKQRDRLTSDFDGLVEAVESMVCVPVVKASDKEEYAARTIRSKIMDQLGDWVPSSFDMPKLEKTGGSGLDLGGDPIDFGKLSGKLETGDAEPVDWIEGGHPKASERLTSFLRSDLSDYEEGRSNANEENVSHLSPYLRFGHIAPTEVVRKVRAARPDGSAFVEELVVRRELTCNFCHYNDDYDSLRAIPEWARETLDDHESEERDPKYGATSLEKLKTDDEIWNAAMREMEERGYLHNHVRMYWGKYVLNVMRDAKTAHRTLLDLNNRYFLDGGDPNSFANVLWCFGLHDRGFQEGDVRGKVRPFTDQALERKFDVGKWVAERQPDAGEGRG